ncbi:hypothetical protein MATL_G00077750 [Megalops atlanticus]|uniref:Ig-like domain-containing protein n=1 Tax=Megalops atlanticus TaxID=7932 RepID=A0A9D3Q8Z7_MEGAT|nr:hypothetical protein MATL_G00077750 [Megalops atlanticus]
MSDVLTMKRIPVYLLICWLRGKDCELHSLGYLYTVSSPPGDRPEFELTTEFDWTIISHCDSNEQKDLLRRDWVKEILSADELENRNKQCRYESGLYEVTLLRVLELTNSTSGLLQRRRGCSVSSDGSMAAGFDRWGFNGEDFLTFDLDAVTWRSHSPQALRAEQEWNQRTLSNKIYKDFLLNECQNLLRRFMKKEEEGIKYTVPEVHTFAKFVPEKKAVSLRCQVACHDPTGMQILLTRGGQVVADRRTATGPLPNMDGTVQLRLSIEISPADTLGYRCEAHSNTGNISVKMG